MPSTLSQKIKHHRKAKGLTLEGLAKLIGAGKSYVWELENKGLKKPSGERLYLIAGALGVTSEYLLEDNRSAMTDTEKQKTFFNKYSLLSESDQNKVLDIMDVFLRHDK